MVLRGGTKRFEIVLAAPFSRFVTRPFGVEFAEVPEIVGRVTVVVRRRRFCAWGEPDVRDA